MSPEYNTLRDTTDKEPKQITLDEEAYNALAVADAGSPEVADFLKSYGVVPGGVVKLRIQTEGKPDKVRFATTDMADFLTTDRELTDAYNSKEALKASEFPLQTERDLGYRALESTIEDAQVFTRKDHQAIRAQLAIMDTDVEAQTYGEAHEKEKNPTLARIFKPIIRPETQEMSDGEFDKNYDFLFGDEAQREAGVAALEAQDIANEPIRAAQKEYDSYINDETRQLAAEQLGRTMGHDQKLREILHKHSFNEVSVDVVDAIRTDEALRYDVGAYLLEKLNKAIENSPTDYGDRLVANGNKTNDYHRLGESRMTSRQYASYLALAMIDGSFNGDRQTSSDTVEYDAGGKVINAQHRDAARSIL